MAETTTFDNITTPQAPTLNPEQNASYSSYLSSENRISKYAYSNLTDEILGDLFDNSSNAGARLRHPMITSTSFLVGAFDIGWEGFSFNGVNEIISTGHLLKLINDKIESISGGSQESITDHANKRATQTVLGHTYITNSSVLSNIPEANRSYTAISITALDEFRTEYKNYISETVLGGEVTDKSLDTIKELSEWITTHGEEAADLVSQLNAHEKLQANVTTLGHSYLAQTTGDFASLNDTTKKLAAISVYAFTTYIDNALNSVNSSISSVKNDAYTYAGQVATTAKNDAYAYTNQMIEVAFAWQII